MIFVIVPQSQAQATTFKDVTLYKDEITYLAERNIIHGYGDGTFGPERNLTRLQAVIMILREKDIVDLTAPNPNFTDLNPGDYGYEFVAKAVELGFIGGKTATDGSKSFDPHGALTRGQMAKILAEGYDLTKTKDYSFVDVGDTHWAKDYVSILASEDITTGYQDGTFKPEAKLQRQHFAVFMARLLQNRDPDIEKPAEPSEPEPSEPDYDLNEVVSFADSNIEFAVRVKINKEHGDILKSDVLKIKELKVQRKGIENLSGLEHLVNLETLDLSYNDFISNLEPIKDLLKLTELSLHQNNISSIEHLSKLTNLNSIHLGGNKIVEITALRNLSRISYLSLINNNVNDVSPLLEVDFIHSVNLVNNDIYSFDQQQLIQKLRDKGVYVAD